ncbi:winged helix-turn-helix domain-containing protein [Wenzhouxiangella marina]|uniref:Uncharacterized protein n=1 Tax=Wenzhouxiangella marina TaxID=1579979 RepID=A0A0K0XW66_9GAMM|nr:winged helix-turn-helix domain-containing protein [Wenzhouxiangella marina]AKS41872.1 hypothetical protein WM2015_1501 [Wenzhouxiangella marina]MBB6086362.1 DNA-binding winged helix-turn-helix (wHTH) protein/Flp pilus assembly protein TadD [Wenzhouxiangella marina]
MTLENIQPSQSFTIGVWRVHPASGALERDGEERRLEPKVMQLLCLLAEHAPEVVGRETVLEALWPTQVVGEDALARCLLKLRRALDDDARDPRYIETLPRRGYRLLVPVEAVEAEMRTARPSSPRRFLPLAAAGIALLFFATAWLYLAWPDGMDEGPLLARAHDHYYRFNRVDNERAHLLYQRLLEAEPDRSEALAGLANTLIQRLIRWPETGGPVPEVERSVAAALDSGRLELPWARATLAQAELLVESAVREDPESGFAWKAHGLVHALNRRLDEAQASYRRALDVDPDNWEAAANLGELYLIAGEDALAVAAFERAYGLMDAGYSDRAQRIGPWQPEVGILIGALHRRLGADSEAERWYRRVLESTPLHAEATVALAEARAAAGDEDEAESLCRELISRIGPLDDCQPYLPER